MENLKKSFFLLLACTFLGISSMSVIQAMEAPAEDQKLVEQQHQAIFWLDTTAERDSKRHDPDKNKAILNDCKHYLRKFKHHEHVFLNYGLLQRLLKVYREAATWFADKSIKEPAEQIIITNDNESRYLSNGEFFIEESYQTMTIVKHSDDVFAATGVPLTSENYHEHIIRKCDAEPDFISYLAQYLVLANDAKWYDTHLGLYYVTKLDSNEARQAINIERCTQIDPLQEHYKPNSNEWVSNLDKIFTSNKSQLIHWAISLHGHGSRKHTKIAGLSKESLAKMLGFFNDLQSTTLLAVNSCYTTPAVVLKIAKDEIDKSHLNFALMAPTSKEKAISSCQGIDEIESYMPEWYNNGQQLTHRCFDYIPGPLSSYLVRLQSIIIANAINGGTDATPLIEFLKSIDWYRNPALILAGTNKQIEICYHEN